MQSLTQWIVFGSLIAGLLSLDLGVFHRKARAVSFKESLQWSGVWIACALLFNLYIFFERGLEAATCFFTGYLVEKSLSIDNLFVFLFIFRAFKTPANCMHKVLFWGVLGAIFSRALLIVLGLEIITRLHWAIYWLGGFLILGGLRLFLALEKDPAIPGQALFTWLERRGLMSKSYQGSRFYFLEGSKRVFTPLFAVLISIETADLFFSIDSIPAILAITLDPYIVFTSNIFAVLGLRTLYFALSHMSERFHYLSKGLAAILIFIGFKMFAGEALGISPPIALAIVLLLLITSIVASIFIPLKKRPSSGV